MLVHVYIHSIKVAEGHGAYLAIRKHILELSFCGKPYLFCADFLSKMIKIYRGAGMTAMAIFPSMKTITVLATLCPLMCKDWATSGRIGWRMCNLLKYLTDSLSRNSFNFLAGIKGLLFNLVVGLTVSKTYSVKIVESKTYTTSGGEGKINRINYDIEFFIMITQKTQQKNENNSCNSVRSWIPKRPLRVKVGSEKQPLIGRNGLRASDIKKREFLSFLN